MPNESNRHKTPAPPTRRMLPSPPAVAAHATPSLPSGLPPLSRHHPSEHTDWLSWTPQPSTTNRRLCRPRQHRQPPPLKHRDKLSRRRPLPPSCATALHHPVACQPAGQRHHSCPSGCHHIIPIALTAPSCRRQQNPPLIALLTSAVPQQTAPSLCSTRLPETPLLYHPFPPSAIPSIASLPRSTTRQNVHLPCHPYALSVPRNRHPGSAITTPALPHTLPYLVLFSSPYPMPKPAYPYPYRHPVTPICLAHQTRKIGWHFRDLNSYDFGYKIPYNPPALPDRDSMDRSCDVILNNYVPKVTGLGTNGQ